MSECANCGHPIGPPVDATEETEYNERIGREFVVWFKEKYECENCGAIGWLEHDSRNNRVSEKRYGTLFGERATA